MISESEKQVMYTGLQDQSKLAAYFFRVLVDTGLRISEGLGLSLDDLFKGDVPSKSLDAQLKKEGIDYFGYPILESQPKSGMLLRDADGIVERKPLKGKKVISSQNSRTIPILSKDTFNILAELWLAQKERLDKKVYGSDPKNYLLFDGLNRNTATTRKYIHLWAQIQKDLKSEAQLRVGISLIE